MQTRTLRLAAVAGGLASTAAACGSSNKSSDASSAPTTTAMAPAGGMMLPPYAKAMKTTFSTPRDNATVTANTLAVNIGATGYKLSCDWAGRAPKEDVGHHHLLLDKSLVNMYWTTNASVSHQNVKPGSHTLEVVPALNDHAEVEENASVLHFDYKPSAALPAITDASPTGAPSIHIVSPKPGATVKGNFDVVVDIKNSTASCDLYRKPDLTGYGHWHLNFDTSTGGTKVGIVSTELARAVP